MTPRYSVQGTVTETRDGEYVTFADYDELAALLAEALNDAEGYFKSVESGELTALDANNALRVGVRLG